MSHSLYSALTAPSRLASALIGVHPRFNKQAPKNSCTQTPGRPNPQQKCVSSNRTHGQAHQYRSPRKNPCPREPRRSQRCSQPVHFSRRPSLHRAQGKQALRERLKPEAVANAQRDVEMVAEGPRRELKILAAWAHQGPHLARVTEVEEEWSDYRGDEGCFSIR